MQPIPPVATRITIDFRGDIQPGRAWIIGATPERPGRIELLAVPAGAADAGEPANTGKRVDAGKRVDVSASASPVHAELAGSAAPGAGFATADCLCPAFCERDHANE